MTSGTQPPAGGYIPHLVAAGRFASLPDDAEAATLVHRTGWEPRPGNATANHTVPPPTFRARGYEGMRNRAQVFGRVTGHFTGTTSETIEWAALKWGLPDDLIRAQAIVESGWHQGVRDALGSPVSGQGYGDFGDGPSLPGGYGADGPASFGIVQVKCCAMWGEGGRPADGGWPWVERSTAYCLDFYGAVVRGCVEGWDDWLGDDYRAGDLWGTVGRWYAGEWHSPDADRYARLVRQALADKAWLRW